MNNLQEILRRSKSKGYESLEDECSCEECGNCSFTEVMKNNYCELSCCANKLLEEYKEPHKLNKREHGFCEYAERGYIHRDKLGFLHYSDIFPKKCDEYWSIESGKYIHVENDTFKFIKWEDDEPYSVEEMLKWEVEE